jgi:hypothetical protein
MNSAAIVLDKEIQEAQLKLESLLEQRMEMERDGYRFAGTSPLQREHFAIKSMQTRGYN